MTRLIRIANWTPRNIDPRKPLTGLALRLMAAGMATVNRERNGLRAAEVETTDAKGEGL